MRGQCKYCLQFVGSGNHECEVAEQTFNRVLDTDFLVSAAIGAATNSALLGGLLGGDLLGGVIGDALDGDLFD